LYRLFVGLENKPETVTGRSFGRWQTKQIRTLLRTTNKRNGRNKSLPFFL
jgi:hypothetical protein